MFSIIALIHPPHLHAIDDPTSSESNLNENNDEIDGLTQNYTSFDGNNDEIDGLTQNYYDGLNGTSQVSRNNTAQFSVDSYNTTEVSTTEGHTGSISQGKSFSWGLYIAGCICMTGLLVMLAVTRKVRGQKEYMFHI